MTGTPATVALAAAGIPFVERAFRHDPRSADYGAEAVAALGSGAPGDPSRILKTLVAVVDGEPVVAIVPVPDRLDLRALAAAVGGRRAELADPAVAERRTGYVLGGISPFGQRHAHRTVVDASALRHATVLASGGRRGLDLELAPEDLVRATDAVVAPIARRTPPAG